jgi:hypothetical protein
MTFVIGDAAANVSMAAALRSASLIAIARAKNNLEHVMVRSEYCKIDLNNAPSKADGIDLLTDAANKGGNS